MLDADPKDHLGSVGQLADGRYFVLFERQVSQPVEVVWQAITDASLLAQWFPEIRLDARPGGQFQIWFGDGGCQGPADVTGEVTEFNPPHSLQMGSMRFELQADGQGCLIRFSDILLFDRGRTPRGVTLSVLAGWHAFMDRLQAHLHGQPFDRAAPEFDYSKVAVTGLDRIPPG